MSDVKLELQQFSCTAAAANRGLEVINKRSMQEGSERNVTNDVQVVDQTHLRFTGHLTFVLAVVGASGAAQMKRPRVRIGRMQHLESTVTDERVRIHRQKVTVSFADPRHLVSDTKGGKSMRNSLTLQVHVHLIPLNNGQSKAL